MNEYIDSSDITTFSTDFKDRKDRWDDNSDIERFIEFLKIMYRDRENVEYVPHPFGQYDVDLGVRIEGKWAIVFDLERMGPWDEEWPDYYSHVSFLDRKTKYINRPENFCMVWCNKSRNKFITVDQEQLKRYRTVSRNVQGKNDRVKIISFASARLYGFGTDLTKREKRIFKNHSVVK